MQGLKGVPYTRDGDRPLAHSQLVRLVVLASKVQVQTCVSECSVELGRVMNVEVGMEVLERVPSELDACAEVRTLRQQARTALISAIEATVEGEDMHRMLAVVGGQLEEQAFEEGEEGRLQQAIVAYLGPVHKLWDAGPYVDRGWTEGLSDKAKVRVTLRAALARLQRNDGRLLIS
jgi:hypothetical protein